MKELFEVGFVRIARQICQSEIWERPPHYLKLFIWLIVNANWKPLGDVGRGEILADQFDLDRALRTCAGTSFRHYTYGQIRGAIAWLVSAGMIKTRRYKGGQIITVMNYEKYQEPQRVGRRKAAVEAASATEKPAPEEIPPDVEMAHKIIDLLNGLSGKRFGKIPGNLANLLARIREIDPTTKAPAHTYEDFDAVLRKKVTDEWFQKDNFRYYNPTTLFRPENFPKYVEEMRTAKPPTHAGRVETQEEMIQRLTA